MNEIIENLWSQFWIETQEHIEEIELNLMEAEGSGATPELVGSLFRGFHSLKGLANVMGMSSFARYAHRAEDILGVIRDGEFPMNSDVISLLLSALDEIRQLRLHALSSHTDTETETESNSQLLEELASTFSTMESGRVHHKNGNDVPVQETPVARQLQADPEMFSYFIELAREKISSISRLLEPLCTVSETSDPKNHGEFISHAVVKIDELSYAARTMEFFNLVEILGQLRNALTVESPLVNDQRDAITESLRELHDQIRHIECSSGNPDAGANRLHTILNEVMHVNIQRIFKNVLTKLDALQESSRDSDDLLIAQNIQVDLSALNSHMAFFMNSTNCTIILMLEDVFSRASRGELHLFSEIIEMTREEVTHVMENYRGYADGSVCARDNDDTISKLQRIHDYIWAFESGYGINNPVETFRQFMGGLNIEPELLKILSPENVRELMQALEKGEQIFELLAHLESNEEMTARFLGWIESGGSRIITNRSLFIEEKSWYEMLMVSPLSHSEISQRLAAIDPYGSSLHLKRRGNGLPEKEKLLKALDEIPEQRQQNVAPGDVAGNVIRVRGEALDNFMNLIGEMVLARSRLHHIVQNERLNMLISRLRRHDGADNPEAAELLDLAEGHRRDLLEADQLLQNSLGRLQESAVGLRVVPVEMVFKRLPRVVRDLSRSQEKMIRLEMSGQEVRIDKAMVEILVDPLLHMVRNSVDHGIEMPAVRTLAGKRKEAVIRVSAVQRGNSIVIDISDDGSGIDTDKVLLKAIERGLTSEEKGSALSHDELLRFIFQPGFSTAAEVTETSGRGVGLDVVMTNVMRMGGTITIDSEAGRGTTFSLMMPLSAAIQEVLMVEAAGHTLALPGRYVAEVIEIATDDLHAVRGGQAVLLRGAFLPLYRLARLLGYPAAASTGHTVAVVLSNGNQTIGLAVDKVLRRQELFVKDIQESVAALPGVGGASILGDGRVVLILDGEDLLQIAKSGGGRQ